MLSAEYQTLLRDMHEKHPDWGTTAHYWAKRVMSLAEEEQCESVLDYGCGKRSLEKEMRRRGSQLPVFNHDPGMPELAHKPDPADLVTCIDVLEHVEPQYVNAVLEDLKRVVGKVGFFVISTQKARAILPDGRNAHLTVQGSVWWKQQLMLYFNEIQDGKGPSDEYVVVVRNGTSKN